MLLSSWRQWLSVTRLQLRHLGRAMEEGLVTTLQRHSHIMNPVRTAAQTSRVLFTHRRFLPIKRTPNPVKLNANTFSITLRKLPSGSRLPVGRSPVGSTVLRFSSDKLHSLGFLRSTVVRSLFTNWNVDPLLRKSQIRNLYSIKSIKFTSEAVKNLLLSLRKYVDPEFSQRPANYDSELFKLMNSQKMNTGAFVQFELTPSIVSDVRFLTSDVLDNWRAEIRKSIEIEKAVEKIWENYGSLPIRRTGNSIRVYFPSLDMVDTERLISDLGIRYRVVYPDYYSVNGSRNVSPTPSVTNMHEFMFSPVLSDY